MTAWFYLMFFITGATGLIYETTFARQLQLTFGSTIAAVSVVVAVFFGGMALGAYSLGRLADKHHPFKVYGFLEIMSGAAAVTAVIIVPYIRDIYALIYPVLPDSMAFKSAIRAILAIIVLLPLTVLIGATLPALSKGVTRQFNKRFSNIGGLYGLNTFGAALGCLLCGFILLEYLGYRVSVIGASAINLAIGIIALNLAPKLNTESPVQARSGKEAGAKEKLKPRQVLILIIAGFSGLTALGYEIVWFRTLNLSVVVDSYAFALMLGIYLIGIAIGSLIASGSFRKREGSLFELGITQFGILILAVGGFIALNHLDLFGMRPDPSRADYWWRNLLTIGLKATVLILPSTIIMGYAFPILVSLYTHSKKGMAGQVGRVLAFNTLGGIIGSIISGFILIPALGIQNSLLSFAVLSGILGMTAFYFSIKPNKARISFAGFSGLIVIATLVFFPVKQNLGYEQIPGHENSELLFYKEAADQTVMVTRDRAGSGVMRLIIDQQQATSTSLTGQRKNQILGHLPVWACPGAETALVICFGSGGTFGSLGLYDLTKVDCVEICPSVLEAAHLFSKWNGDVLTKPNVEVIIDDGRSYLLTTDRKYDIITLEPMHPGLRGVSSLYSVEFYEEGKKCLNPRGVLCQWIPLYSMTGGDARALMKSALEVFPQSSLWLIGNEGIMLCARDSIAIDWQRMNRMFNRGNIQDALERVRLDNLNSIISGYLLGPDSLRAYLEDTDGMNDNRPFCEYSIARHQHIHPWDEILKISEARELPGNIFANVGDNSLDSLYSLWEGSKESWIARDHGFAAYEQGDLPSARKYLERVLKEEPNDRYALQYLKQIYWRYGREFSRIGEAEKAIEVYRAALNLEPDDPDSHFYLAIAQSNSGDIDGALEHARSALQYDPGHNLARSLVASIESGPGHSTR
ncbi:MAG: MFS transporter [candidate division Zixibacteria bacterium]|nr:MFS transporter [candidate division Zixibacteria bacterium]